MGYGMNAHLGISFQQSFGTSFQDSMHYFPLISESLTEGIPEVESEAVRGRYEAGDSFEGMHEYAGDVVFDGHPILLGKMLKAWFGQSSGTLADSHYTHEFSPILQDFDNLSALPPMSIEIYRDAGSAHLFSDMLCNQLVIEIAHGAIVKATASMIGANSEKIVKSVPSFLPGSDYIFDQASFSFQGSNNGGIDIMQNMSVTLNNQLEAVGTLNSTRRPSRIKRSGFRMIEISGTMLFENDDEPDHFLNSAQQRVVTTLTGQIIDSVAAVRASLEMDFPSFRYTEIPPQTGGPGLQTISFGAKAKYNVGSATMAKFTMVNTLSEY
jgi:hypothetical protein